MLHIREIAAGGWLQCQNEHAVHTSVSPAPAVLTAADTRVHPALLVIAQPAVTVSSVVARTDLDSSPNGSQNNIGASLGIGIIQRASPANSRTAVTDSLSQVSQIFC